MAEPYILINGIKYSAYRPWDCRYCYYWAGKKKGCSQKECYYLIKAEDLIQPKEYPAPGHCPGCPYGRVHLCIGYCTAKLLGETVKDHKKATGPEKGR